MSDIIDVNVSQTVEEVTIIATPTNYIVNINKIEAGSAVTSVNGLTGDVLLTIPSISGLASTTYVDSQDALKVDKITGYSLTKNDLTNALKTAYDSVVTWVLTNGTALISHLTNYLNPHNVTASQVGAYTTTQVDNLLVNTNVDAVDKISVKLGVAINKGQAVYVSNATGTNMIVSKASNSAESTSSKTLGLLETSGAINDFSKVITLGLFSNLDTSTATIGDPVWLGTNGNIIFGLANKPVAPAHLVSIGIVTRVSATVGEIFVKVQNGFEIDELHDLLITSKSNEDFLQYESSTSLWKNIQITASWLRSKLGITTLSGSNTGDQDLTSLALKSMSAYSIRVNNTNATTNATETNFRQIGKTAYTGTITWTGVTAPSGSINHSYNFVQIGNLVTGNLILVYGVAGTSNTAVSLTFPTDLPTPIKPDGLTSASNGLYPILGKFESSEILFATGGVDAYIRSNLANTGFEFAITQVAIGAKLVRISFQYFTS